jgi:hypothetical protein
MIANREKDNASLFISDQFLYYAFYKFFELIFQYREKEGDEDGSRMGM